MERDNGAGQGSRNRQRSRRNLEEDGVELAQLREVAFVNNYAVIRAYTLMGLKNFGYLALTWSTVVLLGGFVTSLSRKNFGILTFISLLQAAGLFDTLADEKFRSFKRWLGSLINKYMSLDQHPRRYTRASLVTGLKKLIYLTGTEIMLAIAITLVMSLVVFPTHLLTRYGALPCFGIAVSSLLRQNYGIDPGDASMVNLKPAFNIYYSLTAAQSGLYILLGFLDFVVSGTLPLLVNGKSEFHQAVIAQYFSETKQRCANDPSCTGSWDLIAYAAGLLDSASPEDYLYGARVLNMLIEEGLPARPMLSRLPRRGIWKLMRTLCTKSPFSRQIRGLAARILSHLATDLNLSQFPGSLECVSSLLDTSAHNDDDEETVYVCNNKTIISDNLIIDEHQGTNEDMILQGLIILGNLSSKKYNSTVICKSEGLLAKILAPVGSNSLVRDVGVNAAWGKVVEGSLRLVSRLMAAPSGRTRQDMQRRLTNDSNAVENLLAVLAKGSNSRTGMELRMRAMEVLAQLFSDESTTTTLMVERRENLIMMLMSVFLNIEEPPAILFKEKAGETLSMLSMGSRCNSEVIAKDRAVVRRATEMLDSENLTINCKITAAEILKHLCTHSTLRHEDKEHIKETTLNKVLTMLLGLNPAHSGVTSTSWCCFIMRARTDDIENPRDGGQRCDSSSPEISKKESEKRRLQAALLSLCATIRVNLSYRLHFNGLVEQLVSMEGFIGRLKKIVEENSYATPACLAILKHTCEMTIALIQQENCVQEIKEIIDTLWRASETMAGLESYLLFAGTARDCHGVPVKPLSSTLVEQARELLSHKEQELGISVAAGGQ
ncbi:unnamed protein product [Urochloa humidicola]